MICPHCKKPISVKVSAEQNVEIKVKRGLIFTRDTVVSCPQADRIAQANDLSCAEHFVEKYKDKELVLDADFKIITSNDTES